MDMTGSSRALVGMKLIMKVLELYYGFEGLGLVREI